MSGWIEKRSCNARLEWTRPRHAALGAARVRAFVLACVLGLAWGLLASETASAEEWRIVGARHHALGGAGVAAAQGSQAAHWNPGALGFETDVLEIEAPIGLTLSAKGDLLENGARLADFVDGTSYDDVIDKIDDGAPLSESELRQTIVFATRVAPGFVERGQGAFGTVDGGLNLRRGRWVLSVRSEGTVGADPRVDLQGLAFTQEDFALGDLVMAGVDRSAMFENPGSASLASALAAAGVDLTQAQAEEIAFQAEQAGIDTSDPGVRSLLTGLAAGSGQQNQTSARVRALYTKEVGIAWGIPLLDERLALGFNLKYIHGTTVSRVLVADDDQDRSIRTADRRRSRQVGVDVGLLLEPTDWLRLGLTVRNANRPSFETRGGTPIVLDAQVRAGGLLYLSERWLLAADIDLVENEYETIRDLASQTFSLGTEYRTGLFGRSIDLRAGIRRDLANSIDDDIVVSAGVGLYFGRFRLDLALASGLEREDVDAVAIDVPDRIDLAVTLRYSTEF